MESISAAIAKQQELEKSEHCANSLLERWGPERDTAIAAEIAAVEKRDAAVTERDQAR